MLGIIIGIASIIAIFSIIEGNTAKMKTDLIGGNNNTIGIKYEAKSYFDPSIASKKNPISPNYIPNVEQTTLKKILHRE